MYGNRLARGQSLAFALTGSNRLNIIALLHEDFKTKFPEETRRTPAQVRKILEFSCARARDGCAVNGPIKGKLLEKIIVRVILTDLKETLLITKSGTLLIILKKAIRNSRRKQN